MSSDRPRMFWRRVGIVVGILAAAPAGGLFVLATVRFLAFACGVPLGDSGREALLAACSLAAILSLGLAGAILSLEWERP